MVQLSGRRGFESDNCSTVHPRVMRALQDVNVGHVPGYGYDPVTAAADRVFNGLFGKEVDVFYTFNGTGTNCAALAHLVRPCDVVVCADTAHINCAETAGPERIAGAKLIGLRSPDGRVAPAVLDGLLGQWQSEHTARPRVLSLTQLTDEGAVYSPAQIRELSRIAHGRGLFVHMDGARLANAVAACGDDLRGMTSEAGVDVLSFGGTKNGLMFGEAVVFLRRELSDGFKYTRKGCGQLPSKMRYIAAQFIEVLKDGLWLQMAHHANDMAGMLYRGMLSCGCFRAPFEPQANELFAHVDAGIRERLRAEFPFLDFGPEPGISRFVTSHDTTEKDIADFLSFARGLGRPGRSES